VLLCSERVDRSESGEVDERLLSRLLSGVVGLFGDDSSSTIDESMSSGYTLGRHQARWPGCNGGLGLLGPLSSGSMVSPGVRLL
jgi:hypothetical protein